MVGFTELVLAASSVDSPLIAWDLHTGKLRANYKQTPGTPMASPRNSLCSIGSDYFAASQILKSGGAICAWLWHKSTVVLKSFPVEAVDPLACSSDGTLLIAGGHSGRVYLWEVATGRLLRSWAAHYKAVTCLAFSDDDSLIISGGEDALVNVWPVIRMLDGANDVRVGGAEPRAVSPMYSWADHSQMVTGLFAGSGGSSAVVVSCSADHTCKFYSLALGALLRSIVFPVEINAALMDPGEYCLYAGGNDGRIFITSLNYGGSAGIPAESGLDDTFLHGHKRAVTALAFSMDSVLLVSASEDCTACVWDTASRKMLRRLEHPKGPITSILLLPTPAIMPSSQSSDHAARFAAKRGPSITAAQLHKYPHGAEGTGQSNPWEGPPVVVPAYLVAEDGPYEAEDWTGPCFSRFAIERQMAETEEGNSVASLQVALEKKRAEVKRALDLSDGWREQFDQSYQVASNLLKYAGSQREKKPDSGEGESERGRSV